MRYVMKFYELYFMIFTGTHIEMTETRYLFFCVSHKKERFSLGKNKLDYGKR